MIELHSFSLVNGVVDGLREIDEEELKRAGFGKVIKESQLKAVRTFYRNKYGSVKTNANGRIYYTPEVFFSIKQVDDGKKRKSVPKVARSSNDPEFEQTRRATKELIVLTRR